MTEQLVTTLIKPLYKELRTLLCSPAAVYPGIKYRYATATGPDIMIEDNGVKLLINNNVISRITFHESKIVLNTHLIEYTIKVYGTD